MSSYPGPRLEDYLLEAYVWPSNVDPSQYVEHLARLYEPWRTEIEDRLENFPGDEEASWRDYRNSAFENIEPYEIEAAAIAYIRALIQRPPV